MMNDLEKDFGTSIDKIKSYEGILTIDEKLELYKYYKQATVGDVNIRKPWVINFEASQKWEAWNSVKGHEKSTAMSKYIDIVNQKTK